MEKPRLQPVGNGRDPGCLVVAISSRALFDLDASHALFEREGVAAYKDYQVAHEEDVLAPGTAFTLVQKLLALNADIGRDGISHPGVEVILLSRNSTDTGLRIFNTVEHYGLDIQRAAFTSGGSPHRYMEAYGAHLFLSTHADDVRRTLEKGYAAAQVLPGTVSHPGGKQLRIAFDGDAVLFSDEAERVYKRDGLAAFSSSERQAARRPLSGGPFRPVLEALHKIQSAYPPENNPIRTALVTARSAPAHKRVILTLREWGIRIDEALFLGGREKGPFLKAFGADIFFDDQQEHCASATHHVATGHVPHGVANEALGSASGSEADPARADEASRRAAASDGATGSGAREAGSGPEPQPVPEGKEANAER